ncbi:MAG: tRNA (adenosine(37)-N6)-dimethylallyltransferase MiaA [Christensenellaceae bacterium]|nr:tRNA (adenosine(37)-N6)-dimethylallyltransferase MiaA [Christensenellaceae bacterium]
MIIVIGGATASGKTAVGSQIAKQLNTSIVSADSMQIYKWMDIGTAKISDEMLGVKQYCIDLISPLENFSVVDYRDHADKAISEILSDHKIPIVVGGTGYFISSILYQMSFGYSDELVDVNGDIRLELENEFKLNGILNLYKELIFLDPEAAQKIHFNNTKRVLRALEVIKTTGKKYSTQNDQIIHRQNEYQLYIITSKNRQERAKRISARTDLMYKIGLKDEVDRLLSMGCNYNMQSMQGIGYKEWEDFDKHKYNLNDTLDYIKINTRQYAKRQDTWFNNKYKEATYLDIELGLNNIYEYIMKRIPSNT